MAIPSHRSPSLIAASTKATEGVLSCLDRVPDAHQFNSGASKDKNPARDSRIAKCLPACSFEAVFVPEPPFGCSNIRHDSYHVVKPDHGSPWFPHSSVWRREAAV